jgi:hypothetical protein
MNLRKPAAIAVVLACASLAARVEGAPGGIVPEAFPADRYAAMKEKSPFALATPVAVAETPSFAQGMFVSGLAKLSDDQVMVTVTDKDKRSFTLVSGAESSDGMSIVSVDWSDEIGKTKVTVKKGAEFGTLQFNEVAIKTPIQVSPVPAAARPRSPRVPRGRPQLGSAPRPQVRGPGTTIPQTTRRRPIIRRPSQ